MDVKRLKVTELRAELGRRGLDSRGLKVELAQRLQEALDAEMLAAGPEEAGAEAGGAAAAGQGLGRARLGGGGGGGENDGDEEEEDEDDEEEEEEDEEALLADEDEAATAPGGGGGGPAQASAPSAEEQASAQPGGGVNGAQGASEEGAGSSGGGEEEEAAAGEGRAEAQTGAQAQANEEDEKAKEAGPDGERQGLKRQRDEKDEHGRAYCEFREEVFNSRSKSPPPPEEEAREEDDETLVILDTYTADLQFRATKDRYGGQPLFHDKFPNLWSGARSTHGVKSGKVCFEAKVTQNLPLKEGSTEPQLLRVGWSVDFSCTQLGEDEYSYGYDGRGLKAENGQFEEFGQAFGENDVIGCFANFESSDVELSFSKNGEDLGVAFSISKEVLGDRALLPHVLCINCVVELNFGQKEEPFFPIPEDYTFIHAVPVEDRVRTPLPPKTTGECEVLIMVGLPGCGKTHWARKHIQENPDKRFLILGTETVIHQMKTRGPEPEETPDRAARDQLFQQAARCVSKLAQIAPRTKRNFILDQCNVYNSGQRRKLHPFKGFIRKVIVVVPSEENWEERLEQREEAEGEDVPDSVMLEMKANFSLPDKCDYVDEVLYQELPKEEAQALVTKYKEEARKLLPPSEKRTHRRNNRNKRNRQNRNRGQGYAAQPRHPSMQHPPGMLFGGQRRGYNHRAYGQGQQQQQQPQQQQYWGQPGNRGGYRNFYDRYRGGDYNRFYGRDFEYNRYRDYYRDYNREWQNYYQDRDRYYRNYYGYQGYR
ncbi:heterogeneous nuclear ribonucleoprotein U-like protein 2 isoform X1 [Anolis carolinensis]|uniref:heterogeneous nuclear ribonucleoprotein U-like protein 2 isoform X1 n=1 Tax=Anolis carolinensis TaxID=28377 RepID=UPI0007DB701E|nr:PREDICTED: heterogeneous nuclear ribonucleoprotein U-like protein 2 isoform X1 [Anolis carolinensis]|eukprot:XP_008121708.2 PREDICTED: heterogeneous nuclear ribonucleoprotein U-like protein 2 isoform X1 [Anolis carolinensis]